MQRLFIKLTSSLIIVYIPIITYITINKKNINFEQIRSNKQSSFLFATKNETAKPVLVLHVGPPKTSSTSLQNTLFQLKSELENDNWYFVGKYGNSDNGINSNETLPIDALWDDPSLAGMFNQCLKEFAFPANRCQWQESIRVLERHFRLKHNVILSDESISVGDLSTFKMKQLQTYVLEQGWTLQIVIVHRNFFDWLPSLYNQKYKPIESHAKLNEWLAPSSSSALTYRTPTFPDYLQSLLDRKVLLPYSTSSKVRYWFKKYFEHVTVLSMHKYVVNDFVCNVLQASGACYRLKTNNITTTTAKLQQQQYSNPSIDLAYDIIALKAYESNIINGTSFSRESVRRSIHDFHKTSKKSLPLVCITAEQKQKLFEWSKQEDNSITHTESCCVVDDVQYRNLFDISVDCKASDKYCSVDAAKLILDDREWIEFFASSFT